MDELAALSEAWPWTGAGALGKRFFCLGIVHNCQHLLITILVQRVLIKRRGLRPASNSVRVIVTYAVAVCETTEQRQPTEHCF